MPTGLPRPLKRFAKAWLLHRPLKRFAQAWLLPLLLASALKAQEFNCQVSVIAPQVATAQPRVFQSLEVAIKEFYQNRRFTNHNYAPTERIDINILLTISNQPAPDRFEGSLQVIYARPVFGSDYNSPILDLVDDQVQFNFLENTQIEFSPDRFINNLSSLLGYYAYFVLGLDGDTYAPLGGSEFYTQAQQVLNNAQNDTTARTPLAASRAAFSDRASSNAEALDKQVSLGRSSLGNVSVWLVSGNAHGACFAAVEFA